MGHNKNRKKNTKQKRGNTDEGRRLFEVTSRSRSRMQLPETRPRESYRHQRPGSALRLAFMEGLYPPIPNAFFGARHESARREQVGSDVT